MSDSSCTDKTKLVCQLEAPTSCIARYAQISSQNINQNNVGRSSYNNPAFADVDGDKDMDLLLGDHLGLRYFENIGSVNEPAFVIRHEIYFENITNDEMVKPCPTFHDTDADGDVDLIVLHIGGLKFYENVGTFKFPQFELKSGPESNPFHFFALDIEFQKLNVLRFWDSDHDGDYDLVLGGGRGNGTSTGGIFYWENVGSDKRPDFSLRVGKYNPFHLIGVTGRSCPILTDVDNDGDDDLFSGGSDGSIFFFENTGTRRNPTFTARNGDANPFNDVDAKEFSRITMVNISGDPFLSFAISGMKGGYGENYFPIMFHKVSRTITDTSYTQLSDPENNPFYGINIDGADSHPFFGDLDDDGDLDLVLGEAGYQTSKFLPNGGNSMKKNVTYYENIGTVQFPSYSISSRNPFAEVEGQSPALADIDQDGGKLNCC